MQDSGEGRAADHARRLMVSVCSSEHLLEYGRVLHLDFCHKPASNLSGLHRRTGEFEANNTFRSSAKLSSGRLESSQSVSGRILFVKPAQSSMW